MTAGTVWLEVGDRVFTRRYRFFDQQIGAILTEAGPIVIDTRSTAGQAREILDELRALTPLAVAAVVNTHHHYDHAFGNAAFRPAPIWGHVRCAEFLRERAEAYRLEVAREELPKLAQDVLATEIDPPDRTFGDDGADLDVGGRRLQLRYLGRGHTDDDVVIVVPDAAVLFAGDLVENGAPPYFGDGFPLDWPDTLRAARPLVTGAVVPGHGDVDDVTFLDRSIAEVAAVADLSRRVAAGELGLEEAIAAAPYRAETAREAIERGFAQARGELDPS
jgi:glyoxylase-like metal-dependent hydrolase (beta-lactamase superfamily II)